MSNVWLLITIWGMNGAPAIQKVPYNDMEACELARQNLPSQMLSSLYEEFNIWRNLYDSAAALGLPIGVRPRKPGGTFVCTRTSKPWVDEPK